MLNNGTVFGLLRGELPGLFAQVTAGPAMNRTFSDDSLLRSECIA